MALQDTLARLGRTPQGRVVLVVMGLYALVVLGDGGKRMAGMSPYVREYSGEVVDKHQSKLGWFVHILSGRAIFGTTDGKTRRRPVGPWRLTVSTEGGEVIEVAVARSLWEKASPGRKVSCRLDPAFAALK